MSPQFNAYVASMLKPTRLNFAGYCEWCEQRFCESRKCIHMHDESKWALCLLCNGVGYGSDGLTPCGCTHGLTQIGTAETPTELPSVEDVSPISVPPATTSGPLPRCLTCGHRTATPHTGCSVPATLWQPCADCHGLRTDADGVECQTCCGVGFIELSAVDTLAERADDVPPWAVAAHA